MNRLSGYGAITYRFGLLRHAQYPIGPLNHGTGVTPIACSHSGRMGIGRLACPEQLAEPDIVTDAIRAQMRALTDSIDRR